MELRRRTRTRTIPGGVAFWRKSTTRPPEEKYFERRTITTYNEYMEDRIGKKRDLYGQLPISDLLHRRTWLAGGPVLMSGKQPPSTYAMTVQSLSASLANQTTHLAPPGSHSAKDKGNDAYVQMLVERTNPFRPQYSVFVAFREMVEILTLFSIKAKTLAGLAGGAYLNFRFGWLAFLRDLKAASGVFGALESRLLELRSLQQHGGLRRSRVLLDSYSTREQFPLWVLNSAPAPSRIDSTDVRSYTTKVYGSVRWYPAPGAYHVLEDLTPLQEFNLAVKLVLDLQDPGPASVWEIIPFSWLIDYFYEIGPYLEATRGANVVEPHYVTITRRTSMRRTGTIYRTPDYLSTNKGPDIRTEETKRVAIGNPSFSFPSGFSLLTFSELKVLLALVVSLKR